MHHCVIVIITLILGCNKIASEWIEITQPNQRNQTTAKKPNIKAVQKSDAYVLYRREDSNTPSPEWLAYQRERFGNNRQNTNTQQLVISSGEHLKNTAQVVVPAKTAPNTSTPKPKHEVFQTKTRLNVLNNRPDSELVKIPSRVKVETTSRREMSHGETTQDEEEIDNDANAEVMDDDEEVEDMEEDTDDAQQATQGASGTEQNSNSHLQSPSIQGFFKFLKTIKHNWLKKSGFGMEQKIKFLKTLRDKLMRTIAKQFTMLWQPSECQRRRRKRGLLDESNLNFPPEAALMSLNFLTFAVFLIKLVLQVVHIVKSKHYNFTGFNVNAEPIAKSTLRH